MHAGATRGVAATEEEEGLRAPLAAIGLGVQLTLVLTSGVIFAMSYNQLMTAIAKAGQMDPEGQHGHVLADTQVYIKTSVWTLLITILASAPYAIFQGSFTAFQHYLVMLPPILIIGVVVAWIAHLLLVRA